MIIKKLTLHNFGIYAGTNEYSFSGEKPVVLIGGMNGRGKTTFLEAVLLALYGSNSFAVQESKSTFGQYLRSYTNRADGTLESYIEIDFILDDDSREEYLVRHEWNIKGQRTSDHVSVKKNGEYSDFLSKNWLMFIENILPSALSNFFFFDGEKIAEMAANQTNDELKHAIKSLLGITVIDTLENDINRVIARVSKDNNKLDEKESINQFQINKDNAEKLLVEADEQIDQLTNELSETKEQLELLKTEYYVKGGDAREQRENLIHELATVQSQISVGQEKMLGFASSALPFAMVSDLLEDIHQESKREQKIRIDGMINDRLISLMEKYQESKSGSNKASTEFMEFLNSELSVGTGEDVVYDLDNKTVYQLSELVNSSIRDELKQTKLIMKDQKLNYKKADNLNSYLNIDIDDQSITELNTRINELNEKVVSTEVQLQLLTDQRINLHGNYLKASTEFNRAVEKMLSNLELKDDNERLLKYSNISLRILSEYKYRLQKRKIDDLSKVITNCYGILESKKNLITTIQMDPETLDLKYLDKNNDEVNRELLSAGEKQMMVIAILWALGICSKRKLPVIIDTPLSRLDSSHRSALVQNYFPLASEQTVILSTDSEIDKYYYELMKNNIGDEFTLVYDDETKSTTIKKGYFEGLLK